jgi:hypothetical protein
MICKAIDIISNSILPKNAALKLAISKLENSMKIIRNPGKPMI